MLHPFIGKVKTKKLGAFSFFDSIIDRLSLWVNMCPDAVILQNTKKKSGHTYTMYMDNEVEGNFIGWGSFIGEDKMGKEKWKNLIVPKDLMLGNIDDSFQVKYELSRLDKLSFQALRLGPLDTLLGWVEFISLTSSHSHHCHFNGYFRALLSVLVEENGWNKQTRAKHLSLTRKVANFAG